MPPGRPARARAEDTESPRARGGAGRFRWMGRPDVFERGNTRLVGFCDDLVVHVRIVARIIDLEAEFFKVFADYIINERLIGVPDMRVARHGDTASVHIDDACVKRHEIFFSSC